MCTRKKSGRSFDRLDELDGEEYTRDGTVDFQGRPAIKARTGGWKTSWFIYSNQVFANLVFCGCSTNLVIYLTSVMHQSNSAASTNVSNWNGVISLLLLGPFWLTPTGAATGRLSSRPSFISSA